MLVHTSERNGWERRTSNQRFGGSDSGQRPASWPPDSLLVLPVPSLPAASPGSDTAPPSRRVTSHKPSVCVVPACWQDGGTHGDLRSHVQKMTEPGSCWASEHIAPKPGTQGPCPPAAILPGSKVTLGPGHLGQEVARITVPQALVNTGGLAPGD